MSPAERTDEEKMAGAEAASRPETWQEEMARWKRDPESLKRHKEDIAAVGRMLRDHGVDLPIVLPNPHFPVGDQIGREARIHTGDYLYPVRFGEKFD